MELEHDIDLENDLEDKHEVGWIYEVKVLTPHGQVIKLTYDAHDLSLLGVKGRYPEHDSKDDNDDD